jgi:DNA-binding response OmpR family regulator
MKKPAILYVEDEQFLGKIVMETLQSRGFEVHMATDGWQATEMLARQTPDLCVLDVMLPKKDGFTLAREIRQQFPDMPIIFLTAKTQTDDVLQGFEAGGNDYLRKPFSMEELIVRMQNLLKLHQKQPVAKPGTPDMVPMGAFEFFPQRYELKFRGQVRKLSHRETELLTIFAENQNKVIQRKDILLKVWSDDSFFNSRNLDVYITKIRGYLKEDPQLQIISIKNVGYHFLTE